MNPIQLKPDPECKICRGGGAIMEYHGPGLYDPITCECDFLHAPQDAESQRRIDAGEFVIEVPEIPDVEEPEWPED